MKNSLSNLILILVVTLFSCAFNVKNTSTNKQEPKKQQDTVKKDKLVKVVTDSVIEYKGKFKPYKTDVHASYYADKFNGLRTASGKKFDNNKLTAAHKKLPFGTMVRVTNEKNGKSVVVEVTDRGPFVKGREIDLSKKAFLTVASNKGSGMVIVKLEVLQK